MSQSEGNIARKEVFNGGSRLIAVLSYNVYYITLLGLLFMVNAECSLSRILLNYIPNNF